MRPILRVIRTLVGIALTLGIVMALLTAALAWRLAQGPLDVTPLAQRAAARFMPDIQASAVSLAWDGFSGGPRTLHLMVNDLSYAGGAVAANRAAVALSFPRLLEGRLEPTDVVVVGLHLHATRRQDGVIALDGLPTGPIGGNLEDEAQALKHVSLHDATITLTDAASRQSLDVGAGAADLQRQSDGAITGHAEARVTVNDVVVTAMLKAERDTGAVTRLQFELSSISPASLARAMPQLAALDALDAPITLHGKAEFDPNLTLRHAAVQATAGAGIVSLPRKGGGTSPAHFASAAIDAEGNLSAIKLTSASLVLAPPSGAPPTTITVSGDGARERGRTVIHVAAGLDHISVSDLPDIWPAGTGGGARPWLTENVMTGAVHDGRFSLTLEGAGTLDDLTLTQAGGTMAADDVTLYWLRPVPPAEHAQALLTLENPDAMLISFTGARQGRIVERAGNIHITGMSTPHQIGLINADLAGSAPDLVKLLSQPRLNLLSAHPLPLNNPAGDVAAHLTVRIPLEQHVEFDDVAIHATGQISNLHLGGFAEGRDLDQGNIAMDVTNDALKATGTALLANMDATLEGDMDFRPGPPTQVTEHVAVSVQATERQLDAAGLNTFQMVGGSVAAKLDYAGRRNATGTVALNVDILKTSLDTPLGWSKTAGSNGSMEARALLLHGRLVGVDRLRAEAPGLSIEAHSDMVDGRPSVLHLDRGVVGRTSTTGTIRFSADPQEPIRVALTGPRLDLTSLFTEKPNPAEPRKPAVKPDPATATAFAVDLRFGQVLVKQGAIGPVTLTAEGSTSRIARAQLRSSGPENVQASLAPTEAARHLSMTVGDLGLLMRALDTTAAVAGGRLTLNGDFDDKTPGSPFNGVAELIDFRVQGAPLLGKVLQGLTLYGLVDALRGPGLAFDRLASPFRLTGPRLELIDARAYSSSLGVTAKGEINFNRHSLVVDGTIVPAYALNALPGALPLIGRLFSPERGGGVFAATYNLSGSLADPKVGFNPLAALTPGFLRGVFGMLP